MNFNYIPTLQHNCGVKIAAILWNRNILALERILHDLRYELPSTNAWHQMQTQTWNDVERLDVKDSVKHLLKGYINSMGIQLVLWQKYEGKIYNFDRQFPNVIYWTTQGILDRKKIACEMIYNEKVDILIRYKIACLYCLEEDIDEIWNHMLEIQKQELFRHIPYIVNNYEVAFFTYSVTDYDYKLEEWKNEEDNKPFCPYRIGFERACKDGNKASAEYFFHRIIFEESNEMLVSQAKEVINLRWHHFSKDLNYPQVFHTELFCFLFSEMDEEQQSEIIRYSASSVLKCFLDWPWQPLFLEMANRMWEFLDEEDFIDFLSNIKDKTFEQSYSDYDYKTLFGEFWTCSPVSLRKYVLDEWDSDESVLKDLFLYEDLKNVILILKDASDMQRKKILFSYHSICMGKSLVDEENWDSIEFFVRECIATKEELVKFKNEIEKQMIEDSSFSKCESKLDKFSSVLAKLYDKYEQ